MESPSSHSLPYFFRLHFAVSESKWHYRSPSVSSVFLTLTNTHKRQKISGAVCCFVPKNLFKNFMPQWKVCKLFLLDGQLIGLITSSFWKPPKMPGRWALLRPEMGGGTFFLSSTMTMMMSISHGLKLLANWLSAYYSIAVLTACGAGRRLTACYCFSPSPPIRFCWY